MPLCPICHQPQFFRHICAPKFHWCVPESDPDTWTVIWAYDDEQAAINAAAIWDEEERDLCGGDFTITVHIRAVTTGAVTTWAVSGESVPEYHAKQINNGDPPIP